MTINFQKSDSLWPPRSEILLITLMNRQSLTPHFCEKTVTLIGIPTEIQAKTSVRFKIAAQRLHELFLGFGISKFKKPLEIIFFL